MSRSLLGLQSLDAAEIRAWLRAAVRAAAGELDGALPGLLIANLFFEDSTRTRLSFSVAAHRLGGRALDLSAAGSSIQKGETAVDTARNIEAMGVSAFVVRSREAGVPHMIDSAVAPPVLNAGDGRHEHPTQALLDIYTLAEAFGRLDGFDLSGVRVAIVGDIANSRVARSDVEGIVALGGEAVCVGPPALAPPALASMGCTVTDDLDAALPEADAVVMLRIQFERGAGSAVTSPENYRAGYAMTAERAERLKEGAIVMHPGPINRGLELDSAVADGPRSVILRQVANGVTVRTGALARCLGVVD